MSKLPLESADAASLIAGNRTPPMMVDQVTVLLYTSHRVSAFQRLMDTWGNRHTRLMIADASPSGYVRGQDIPDWGTVVRVDPKATMGEALNELLAMVETPYCSVIMDDWVMSPTFNLEYLAAICEAGGYGLVSGRILDLPKTAGAVSIVRRDIARAYMTSSDAGDEPELWLPPVEWDPGVNVVPAPVVSSHYVARTRVIREANGWSPLLRGCHHLDLCLSLQEDEHRVAVTGVSTVNHAPTEPIPAYDAMRAENIRLGRIGLMEKYGARRVVGLEKWERPEAGGSSG